MQLFLVLFLTISNLDTAFGQDASSPETPNSADDSTTENAAAETGSVNETEAEQNEVEPPPELWWCKGLSTYDEKCIPDFVMQEIPGGVVMVGDRDGLFSTFSERRRRRMVLPKSYWMTDTEITQGQFEGLMGFNPSSTCAKVIDQRRPVSCVSWNDALVFANALSEALGFEPVYRVVEGGWQWDRGANGFRLPTSIEWERAALGRSATRYAGSDNLGAVAWYQGNSAKGPQKVRKRMANDFGLYDMTGNVWEWVWDGAPTSMMPTKVKTTVKDTADIRAQRGGSYADGPEWMPIATLDNDLATYQGPTIGFRLVRNGTPIPADQLPPTEAEKKDNKPAKEKKSKEKKAKPNEG